MSEKRRRKEKDTLVYKSPFRFISILGGLSVLISDQLAKLIILKNFHPGESLPVIKNIFHISPVYNKGIAFGLFAERASSIFIWISYICIIIIVFILAFYKKFFYKAKSTQIFLSLILAGAVSNLIDRLRFGFVVDFLDFRIWPVFNIADIAITIGTALLVFQMFKCKLVLNHRP